MRALSARAWFLAAHRASSPSRAVVAPTTCATSSSVATQHGRPATADALRRALNPFTFASLSATKCRSESGQQHQHTTSVAPTNGDGILRNTGKAGTRCPYTCGRHYGGRSTHGVTHGATTSRSSTALTGTANGVAALHRYPHTHINPVLAPSAARLSALPLLTPSSLSPAAAAAASPSRLLPEASGNGLLHCRHLAFTSASGAARAGRGAVPPGAADGAAASGVSEAAEAETPVLLCVHPRHRGPEDREEALRLAESLTGRPCPFVEAGKSRMWRKRTGRPHGGAAASAPAHGGNRTAYFGRGTLREVARHLDALEAGIGSSGGERGRGAGGGAAAAGPGEDSQDGAAPLPAQPASPAPVVAGGAGAGGGAGRAPAFVNAVLTPLQERNIEAALRRPVLDRVGLIIRLFARRARTREARLQVELASLTYQLPRLVRVRGADGRRGAFGGGAGWAAGLGLGGGGFGGGEPALQVVSARQRGSSGAGGLGGGGGAGDPELRQQRFRISARVAALRRELAAVAAARGVQRQGRRAAGMPTVAVVGYTNVGKTSLAGALAQRGAGLPPPADMLFATLDPAVRRAWLPTRGSHVAVSDTVGFIRDLPVGLVAAFRATLEEVVAADMLIHVLDASSPNVGHQRAAVLAVLRQLGVDEHVLSRRTVEVWNKVDLLPLRQQQHQQRQEEEEAAQRRNAGAGGGGGGREGGLGASGHVDGAGAAAAAYADQDPEGALSDEDAWDDDGDLEEADEAEEQDGEEDGQAEGMGAGAHDSDDAWTDDEEEEGEEEDGGGAGSEARGRGAGSNNDAPGEDEQVAPGGSGGGLSGRPPSAGPAARPRARRLFGGQPLHEPLLGPLGPPRDDGDGATTTFTAPAARTLHHLSAGHADALRAVAQPSERSVPLPPAPQSPAPPLPSSPGRAGARRGWHSDAGAAGGLDRSTGAGNGNGPEDRSSASTASTHMAVAGDGRGHESGPEDGDGGASDQGPGQHEAGVAAELAAAAEVVRRVHGEGGAVPAAVVLAAVAEGRGVAEVKAAIEALLWAPQQAGSEATAATPDSKQHRGEQHQHQQGRWREPAGGRAGGGGASASKGARAAAHVEATAAVATWPQRAEGATAAAAPAAQGRWVSPSLWLAAHLPWPLPQPPPSACWLGAARGGDEEPLPSVSPPLRGEMDAGSGDQRSCPGVERHAHHSGADADWRRVRGEGSSGGMHGSGRGGGSSGGGVNSGTVNSGHTQPGGDVPSSAVLTAGMPGSLGQSFWHEPAPARASGSAGAGRAVQGPAANSAGTGATPSGEELEELIRFLRRRPRRNSEDE